MFKNSRFGQEGLVIRYTHAKYESPISKGKQAMANVKVFDLRTDGEDRQKGRTE